MNFLVAYTLLHECFTKRDMWATTAMPRNVPGYMQNYPTCQFLEFCDSLMSNSRSDEGSTLYLLTWLVLLAFSIYLLLSASLAKVPFALPLLMGLFTSQFHFVAKLWDACSSLR